MEPIALCIVPCNLPMTVVSIVCCRQELLHGPLLYIVIVVSTTLFFWRESPIGLMVLCLMCGGDGLADIVGRKYGSAKLPFNRKKSWAGSLAMLAGQTEILTLQECTQGTISGLMHKALCIQNLGLQIHYRRVVTLCLLALHLQTHDIGCYIAYSCIASSNT